MELATGLFNAYFKNQISLEILIENLKYLQQSGLPLYPGQGGTVDLWQRSLGRIQ